jgi:hypothetical protein
MTRLESVVTAHGTEVGRYGLGVELSELVHLERDADGAVASVRLGGATYRPMAEFLRRREAAARGPEAVTGRSAP